MKNQMWKKQLIALQTIVYKEIQRFSRIWIQTIVPPIITTALYFIIFGNLIGRHVPEILGVSYIQFMVPGLVMMAVINNSFANVATSFFSARMQFHVEELLVSPVPNIYILLGYVFGGVARGIVVGITVYLIAFLFTTVQIQHPILMILILILATILFSVAGFINALFAKKYDDISLLPTFLLGPLTYLGGVFYSVDLLPEPWHQISLFNPILYIVSGFRYSSLGIADINIMYSLGVMFFANIIFFVIALYLLNRGYGIRS